MTFKHGVYVTETATTITDRKSVDSSIPVVFGTAPKGRVQTPVGVHSYAEAVKEFWFFEDSDSYTLCEFIDNHFSLYKQSYAILVNVVDVATMKKTMLDEPLSLSQSEMVIAAVNYPIEGSVKLRKAGKDFVETDFTARLDADGFLVITLPAGSSVILPATGKKKGLDCWMISSLRFPTDKCK